jgi:hypothetical protein
MSSRRSRAEIQLALVMGPTTLDGFTEAQLKRGWTMFRSKLMPRHHYGRPTRPWGWWKFEAGEDQPRGFDAQTLRLAELGELRDDELAAVRERAYEARLRIGTGSEHISAKGTDMEQRPDREAVELWERVEVALSRRRCYGRRMSSQPRNRSRRSAFTRSRPAPQRTLSRWESRELMKSRPGPARIRSRPGPSRIRSPPPAPATRSSPAPPSSMSNELPPMRTSSPGPPSRMPSPRRGAS